MSKLDRLKAERAALRRELARAVARADWQHARYVDALKDLRDTNLRAAAAKSDEP